MIYFLLYLFLEVLVSVNISSQIGGLNTFFELIFSAFIGIYILFHFQSTLAENMRAVSSREIDLQKFQELNIFTLLGAILLIIPGFLTDILGVLLQFHVFTSILVNRFSAKYDSKDIQSNSNYTKDDDVIDVEIISDSTARK
jgi:2-isopropylmalate synthase/UPF0716 protein FxsA